ncbi:MAG: flagellar transcriptional regulator FlhD [Gammaproteobacteria bacterium]|nr:flagellar transcriptional regulator FlhD [Gammaproteobacteria bacterium]NIR28867.1 flagellar transcriptional regulator FlhD [Gammaproteobacteria bacterium]NIR97248.1 flagellar transcriptional regulator FlhD [Gammaproteobacteria bacterium]NIT62959.1 flagellar transcriptional regulator FlhD [Gammaproteobacteria bacterium]NIV20649.1 hypothetical protein [Gammaproteobacteria bacterium]
MKMDFSKINLEYLIQARDLARQDSEMSSIVLGMSRELAHLLTETTPQELAQVAEIKPPLFIPRQDAWWWQRFSRPCVKAGPKNSK